MHLHGKSHFSQDDETISLEPNEIAIVDGRDPFRVAFTEPVKRATAVIPHAMIDQRAPWLRSRTASQDCGQFAVCGSGSPPSACSSPPAAPGCERNRSDVAHRQSVQSYWRSRPRAIWRQAACSRNSCSKPCSLFAGKNLTQSAAVAVARGGAFRHFRTYAAFAVPAARAELRPLASREQARCLRQGAPRSAADAATASPRSPTRCGFNDLSHFNKTFRARFGMPPRQWRSWSKQS